MKNRAVIYARFSSHSQTEQSIEGQLRECYDFAKRNNYIVIDEYIDRALTGTTDKRPQFLQMIEDSKKKTFDYVIVYQLDRFARNRYDSANYKNKLKKNGVRVLSAKENITEDASGILVEGLLESMAEYYSAELSQKVRRGIRESLLKGYFIGGLPLYGYDIVDKRYKINEEESKIVKEMFNRYACGDRLIDIVNWLKEKGIKSKQNKTFSIDMINKIIRNTKYMGKYITRSGELYENIVEPIVDERLWKKCNEIMDSYKHKPRSRGNGRCYVLTGKLYCGHCSSVMSAETGSGHLGKVYTYYKCYHKKKKINDCEKTNIRKDDFERFVMDKAKEFVLQQDILDKIARTVTEKFNSEITTSLTVKNLERQLKENERAIDAILDAIQSGITASSTQERLLKLEKEKEELTEKYLTETKHQLNPITEDEVKAFLIKMASKDFDNFDEKAEFFKTFIKMVIARNDRILIIYNTGVESKEKYDIPAEFMNLDENHKISIQKTKETEKKGNKKGWEVFIHNPADTGGVRGI